MNLPLNLPSDNLFAKGFGGVSEKLRASTKGCEAGEQLFSLKNVSKPPSANPSTFNSAICITCLFSHVTNHSTQLLARDSAILYRPPFLFNMPSVLPTLLHWRLIVGPSSYTTTESRNSLSLHNQSIFLHTTSLSVFHSVTHTHTLRLSVCVSFSYTHTCNHHHSRPSNIKPEGKKEALSSSPPLVLQFVGTLSSVLTVSAQVHRR
ncbi:hypothetical protein CH063_15375 [Colletotrichum higginsianum]|uniref:Uncharacterized protein n=1 Tax=Colletotrichum higginsianum (strain IMI 349063) TaxID=759273 RepID=H1W2I9_COLHI|nr:hypothetical protein CH063_15375 [Colletotrichum higginsianum]